MISVIKPKACKYCNQWNGTTGICNSALGDHMPEETPDGFKVLDDEGGWSKLITGPDFHCAHFKEKNA